MKLLRKTKLQYYKNLDLNDVSDNRRLWKAEKPLFSGKVKTDTSITLFENGQVFTNDFKIANNLTIFS